jgi:ribosome-associated translation inhibitor RaiA
MRFRYHNGDQISDKVRETVEKESRHLDEGLAHVKEDLKLLDVTFEHQQRSDSYTAKLVLHVLDRSIAAKGTAGQMASAARRAFDDLYDQLDEFIAKLKGEPEIREAQRNPPWVSEQPPPIG